MPWESRKKTPRDVLRVVFRHVRLLMLAAALFAILALMGATYLPEKYTGVAKFERRVDPAAEELRAGRSESFASRKLTLKHDLAGRAAVERAAVKLHLLEGLPRTPEFELTAEGVRAKEALLRQLQDALEVKWEVTSDQVDLIAVSFTHSDPELAREFPNVIVQNYTKWVSEQSVKILEESKEYLGKQVEDAQRRYDQANEERIDFEKKWAGMMPERPGALDQKIQQLESDIAVLRRQDAVATAELARLEKLQEQIEAARRETAQRAEKPNEPSGEASDAATDGTTAAPSAQTPGDMTETEPDPSEASQVVWGSNPRYHEVEKELREARELLETMQIVHKMTDEHPDVQKQRRRIAQLEQRLAQTPERIRTEMVYERGRGRPLGDLDLSVAIAAAQSQQDMARKELERLNARLTRCEELSLDFAKVRKEYEQKVQRAKVLGQDLERVRTRYTNLEMTLAAEMAGRRTQQESVLAAQPQVRPSSPSLTMILGFALVGGLAFGGGLVFLVNSLDRSITTSDDAAKEFDLPVQGVIGEIITPRQRAGRWLRRWVAWPIVAGAVLLTVAVCAFNVVLWLHYPYKHARWRQDPIGFVETAVTDAVGPQR